ncbi:hypothetical protein [Oceanobacillus arenosus]|nr:hypothetical protein [Oceanobacillus arenosus]
MKKMLFVIGTNPEMEQLIKKEIKHIDPKNIIILQRFHPEILHPFDDLMKDILISVYLEGVQEIYVAEDDIEYTNNIYSSLSQNKELQQKIKAFDSTEITKSSENDISEWLIGKSLDNKIESNTKIIREHPLMPSEVVVNKLYPDKKNSKLLLNRDI